MKTHTVEQSSIIHFFTADKTSAPLWFLVRLYLGYEWFVAGWGKVITPTWFGSDAGAAIQGFVKGAIAKSVCDPAAVACHPNVQLWYASFLQQMVLPYPVFWANLVAVGELLVGVGLIVGLFTGVAAFFGFFMNANYLFAGTVSTNPQLLLLALGVILARRVAGHWGLDRYARPHLQRVFRWYRIR